MCGKSSGKRDASRLRASCKRKRDAYRLGKRAMKTRKRDASRLGQFRRNGAQTGYIPDHSLIRINNSELQSIYICIYIYIYIYICVLREGRSKRMFRGAVPTRRNFTLTLRHAVAGMVLHMRGGLLFYGQKGFYRDFIMDFMIIVILGDFQANPCKTN